MFKNFKVTPAMNLMLHSGLGLLVGILVSVLTAVGQVVLNTGANIHVVYATGISAFIVSLGHSFVALKTNPALPQAEADIEKQLHLSPALIAQLEPIVKTWLAPFLAGELMKIRTPPVSALQGQQAVRTSTPPVQQPIQQRASQPAANNPGNTFQGSQSYNPNGVQTAYNPQGQAPEFWNLQTNQVETPGQSPYSSSGHAG